MAAAPDEVQSLITSLGWENLEAKSRDTRTLHQLGPIIKPRELRKKLSTGGTRGIASSGPLSSAGSTGQVEGASLQPTLARQESWQGNPSFPSEKDGGRGQLAAENAVLLHRMEAVQDQLQKKVQKKAQKLTSLGVFDHKANFVRAQAQFRVELARRLNSNELRRMRPDSRPATDMMQPDVGLAVKLTHLLEDLEKMEATTGVNETDAPGSPLASPLRENGMQNPPPAKTLSQSRRQLGPDQPRPAPDTARATAVGKRLAPGPSDAVLEARRLARHKATQEMVSRYREKVEASRRSLMVKMGIKRVEAPATGESEDSEGRGRQTKHSSWQIVTPTPPETPEPDEPLLFFVKEPEPQLRRVMLDSHTAMMSKKKFSAGSTPTEELEDELSTDITGRNQAAIWPWLVPGGATRVAAQQPEAARSAAQSTVDLPHSTDLINRVNKIKPVSAMALDPSLVRLTITPSAGPRTIEVARPLLMTPLWAPVEPPTPQPGLHSPATKPRTGQNRHGSLPDAATPKFRTRREQEWSAVKKGMGRLGDASGGLEAEEEELCAMADGTDGVRAGGTIEAIRGGEQRGEKMRNETGYVVATQGGGKADEDKLTTSRGRASNAREQQQPSDPAPQTVEIGPLEIPSLPPLPDADGMSLAEQLQLRLQRVWVVLRLPVAARVDMVIKWTGPDRSAELEAALLCWEDAAAAVMQRESAVQSLASTLKGQPVGAVGSAMWAAAIEEQIGWAAAVVQATARVHSHSANMRAMLQEELLFEGELYAKKMQREGDPVQLLQQLVALRRGIGRS